MAELLAAGGWALPGSLGDYLRQALPDRYVVVADPVVHGRPLDAVVVGPGGLTVLQIVDEGRPLQAHPLPPPSPSEGEGARPPLTGDLPPLPPQRGRGWGRGRPAEGLGDGAAIAALNAFLHDEFPALRPAIWHLTVAHRSEADLSTWEAIEMETMSSHPLEEAFASEAQAEAESSLDAALADDDLREAVGLALRDRELTASMRAGKPFVFRSGSLGGGTKVWTVREAVRHMDRYPSDGLFHLRNGTLASWLDEEGACHLAELARQAVRQTRVDPQAALETFLAGTGLVARPRLVVRPARVDLGYVLAGQTASRTVRVSRGPGRGYLYGTLEPGQPWLHVSPRTFTGEPVDVTVSADTDTLFIGPEAQQGEVRVASSASAQEAVIPVDLRVVGTPSPLHRYVVRPAAALTLAALLGLAAGGLFALAQPALPGWLARLPWVGAVSPSIVLAGVLWALCGLLRGLLQPVAWPVAYAARRWLLRTACWVAGLVVLVVAVVAYWQFVYAAGAFSLAALGSAPVAALALVFAVLPATVHEIAANRSPGKPVAGRSGRRQVRRIAALIAGALVLVALVATLPLAGPAWQSIQQRGTIAVVQSWTDRVFARLDSGANALRDQLYLRYYDRRAPATTSTPVAPARADGATNKPK